MREIRTSGSEGGGTQPNASFLPLCAPVSASNPRGASPRRGDLAPRNRRSLRRRKAGWRATGGERSVRNASELDSAYCRGEPPLLGRSPSHARPPKGGPRPGVWSGKPGDANPRIAPGRQWVVGGGMIGRFDAVKRGDLPGFKRSSLSLIRIRRAAGQESEHP